MIVLKFVVELVTWTLYLDCTSVYVWSIFNIVFHQGTLLGIDLLWQCWQSNPTRPKHRCGLPRTHLLLCLKHLSSHPVKTAFGFLAQGGTPCRRKSYCGIVSWVLLAWLPPLSSTDRPAMVTHSISRLRPLACDACRLPKRFHFVRRDLLSTISAVHCDNVHLPRAKQ